MTNQHHTITVTDGKEALVLTFSTLRATWEAYFEIPSHLKVSQPRCESHPVYSDASEALETVTSFFSPAEKACV